MRNRFDAKNQKWDEHKTFHSTSDGFTSFITGEVTYSGYKLDPYICRDYPEYGVSIRSTSYPMTTSRGNKYRMLDPVTGKHIPEAQLKWEGGQYIFIDHDTNKVVGVRENRWNDTTSATFLRSSFVYSVTETSGLVGGTIDVYPPMKEICKTKAKEWEKSVLAYTKLILPVDVPYYIAYGIFNVDSNLLEKDPIGLVNSIAASDPRTLFQIDKYGIRFMRDRIRHTHLIAELIK